MIMKEPESWKEMLVNMRYFVDQAEGIVASDLTHDEQTVRLEKLSEDCYLA